MHDRSFASVASFVSGRFLLFAFGIFFAGAAATTGQAQQSGWRVPDATLRFSVELTGAPSHGSAGYFINLPDGGILPEPACVTTVFAEDEDGGEAEELQSFQLWHNPQSKLSVAFATPKKASVTHVHIYVSGSEQANVWTPESGLKPSAILCVDPTRASLAAAVELGKRGSIGPTVHARNQPGVKQAPFSIGGDPSGRPRPASFYLLTHVISSDPGKTWIAPFIVDAEGESEVYIDGKLLVAQERIDKWGGNGAYFDLDAGMHRVEVLLAADGEGPYSSHRTRGGLMYLTWRTPNATMEELGGVRSKKVPMAGTSRVETRVLNGKEVVRSGACRVTGGVTREGGPVACMNLVPTGSFWFEDESPLVSYELQALAAGHPGDTRYSWSFSGGSSLHRSEACWLFPGLAENQVKLTVTSSAGTSESVQPFFGYATARTDLNKPEHRQLFRTAMTEMLEAEAGDPDPVSSWNSSYWSNLIRTTELGEGYALLRNLFTQRLEIVSGRLDLESRVTLENVFLDMSQRRNPAETLKALDQLLAAAEGERRNELLIRKAELYMYYLEQNNTAADGLARLAEEDSEMAEWARIRLGDMAFLGGDINQATEYYADVQNRARQKRNRPDEVKEAAAEEGVAPPVATAGAVPGADPAPPSSPGGEELPPAEPASDWNVTALLDVANSENIATLIEAGYLMEAQQALHNWEREFPLSKISGDLLLMEAKYYMALEDWLRARLLLTAYCREVDASSFLPDAARMLIVSVEKMSAEREEIREIIEKVQGSLKYHPVAKELEAFLSGAEIDTGDNDGVDKERAKVRGKKLK